MSGVLFAGDLLENDAAPSYGDAFPRAWAATVEERLLPLVRNAVVPGHGGVGDRSSSPRRRRTWPPWPSWAHGWLPASWTRRRRCRPGSLPRRDRTDRSGPRPAWSWRPVNDAEVARAAAAAGAAIVRDRFGGAYQRLDKGGLDFATDVDIDAERAIIEVLRRDRPADPSSGRGRRASARNCRGPDVAGRSAMWDRELLRRGSGRGRQRGARWPGGAAAAVADPFVARSLLPTMATRIFTRMPARHRSTPRGDSRLVDIDLDERPMLTGFEPLALLGDAEFRSAFQPRVTSTSLALTWVAAGRRAAYLTDGELCRQRPLRGGRRHVPGGALRRIGPAWPPGHARLSRERNDRRLRPGDPRAAPGHHSAPGRRSA